MYLPKYPSIFRFYWVLLSFIGLYWVLLASSSWKAKHRFKKKFVDGLIVFRIVLIGKIDRIANVYRRTLSSIGSKTEANNRIMDPFS